MNAEELNYYFEQAKPDSENKVKCSALVLILNQQGLKISPQQALFFDKNKDRYFQHDEYLTMMKEVFGE